MKALVPALAVLLAGCATTAAKGDADIRTATLAFYAPYQAPDEPPADWDRPIYSGATAALIAAWQAARTAGEPTDGLADAGWLCECQDWDPAAFGVTIDAITHPAADLARVSLTVRQGWGSQTSQVLLLRHERGRWLIDDLFSEEGGAGLRQQLAEAVR